MIEIRNDCLYIDGIAIGTEEEIVATCDKANCYDELKTNFKEEGDA